MAKRSWTPVETQLVSEFCAVRYPDREVWQKVRVGQIPDELPVEGLEPSEVKMLGVWRRWVDAIVFDDHRLILIEGAVVPNPGDISQLELYLRLCPMTPELYEFRTWPMQGMLVYGVDDPVVRELAARRTLAFELYQPAWLGQYLSRLFPRHRRAPLSQIGKVSPAPP